MCTVALRLGPDCAQAVVVRDEFLARTSRPAGAHWPELDGRLIGELDVRGAGTSLAVQPVRRAAAILVNGPGAARGRVRSRGMLPLLVASGCAVRQDDLHGLPGFHLVVLDGSGTGVVARVFSWDGRRFTQFRVESGDHVVAWTGLDVAGHARADRVRSALARVPENAPLDDAGWQQVADAAFVAEHELPDGRYGTVGGSAIRLASAEMRYGVARRPGRGRWSWVDLDGAPPGRLGPERPAARDLMTVPAEAIGLDPSDVVRVEDGTFVVPAIFAGRPIAATLRPLPSLGDIGVSVGIASDLVQQQMLLRAAAVGPELAGTDDDVWWAIFASAADELEGWTTSGALDGALACASATGGLPPRRVARGIIAVVRQLRRLPEILAAQAPMGRLAAYRDGGSGAQWSWRPAGRTCAVRVPDNFPTIAVEWLQVLGARRPVVVNTCDGDPVVTSLIAAALYRAGLPPAALSVCHGEAAVVWRNADQLVWPGEDVPVPVQPLRVKTYHFGRSKAVLPPGGASADTWSRLTRLAFEGSGRLCTNVSSLVVVGHRDAAAAGARELAREFAGIPVLDLTDSAARVAAWPDPERAARIAEVIRREIAAGAIDVSEAEGAGPLLVERDGHMFLRPAVLLTDVRSRLFGVEFPFPFVTVAACERHKVVAAVRNSLIVSVLDGDAEDVELLEALADEPTIGKVFAGEHFDRGYEPIDPQEGFLADFLFQKKALLNGTTMNGKPG